MSTPEPHSKHSQEYGDDNGNQRRWVGEHSVQHPPLPPLVEAPHLGVSQGRLPPLICILLEHAHAVLKRTSQVNSM